VTDSFITTIVNVALARVQMGTGGGARRGRWRRSGRVARALALAVGVGLGALVGVADAAFGPLYHEFRMTLAPGERVEASGPLWSREQEGPRRTVTLAPWWSRQVDPELESESVDVLYPLFTYDRYGQEYRWQIFQLLSGSGGGRQSGATARRLTVFPLWFQQRSTDPAIEYTAFWPFYGRLANRIFRDEIRFVMWPAYAQTRKQDVVTDNYLVPVFHRRRGDGLSGWQVWPLVGQEHKVPTTQTNGFGEVEVVGGHEKLFVLWPLFFHNDLGVGTTNPVQQRVLLPLFSSQRSPLRDSRTYLWPFGLTITDDREKQYREVDLPWPLVVFARGEGKTVNRVWPLFSQAHTPVLASGFYLWPLYKYNRAQVAPLDRERTRIMLFLYSDLTERNTETGQALRRTDLWPLFTARRDLDGRERLQVLALLEPLLPNNKSIERSWSPLWALWRSERDPASEAASQSLLWNLYRRETTAETRKCSLLFGLIQYESGPEGKRWRWFHLFGSGGSGRRAGAGGDG